MRFQFTTEELKERATRKLEFRRKNQLPDALGIRLNPTLESCDGPGLSISLRYHTASWMANPINNVHGGIIAAILDTTMGLTTCTVYDTMTPTISMTVNYSLPIPLDVDIISRARVIHTGSTTAQMESDIILAGQPDRILASGSAVYYTAHVKNA